MKACKKIGKIFDDHGIEFPLQRIVDLFKKDRACGFAVMLPPSMRSDMKNTKNGNEEEEDWEDVDEDEDEDGDGDDEGGNIDGQGEDDAEADNEGDNEEGMIRGYGMFPALALCNHACLPSVIRWDLADAKGVSAKDRRTMCYRALYDLPPGTEVTQSYVPLGWGYEDRQEYLFDLYGFKCECARCIIEGMWLQREKGQGKKMKEKQGKSISKSKSEAQQKMKDDAAIRQLEEMYGISKEYIQLFLLRHICDNPQVPCTGTMTPSLTGIDSDEASTMQEDIIYECNVCGWSRSHKDWLKQLESKR